MAKADDIIRQITDLIEARIDAWNSKMPKLQEDAYKVVLELTSELETSNGKINPSVKNIKTIAKIKAELDKTIFSKQYQDDLDEIIKDYKSISELQRNYFTAVVGEFKVPSVLEQIQQLAQDAVIEQLGKDAIGANFTGPIKDILVKNVTSGGSRADFIEQAREFMLNTDTGDGRLVRYTKQIVTDSLNQFSANYNATLTDDLGLDWYKYDGSLKDTSRPFCDALIAAKKTCMPYIHKSQLEEIVTGKICGEQVPIYDKTGLPAGMIAGTNASNFFINRGGYNCNHQLYPVSAAVVPKELIDKFRKKIVSSKSSDLKGTKFADLDVDTKKAIYKWKDMLLQSVSNPNSREINSVVKDYLGEIRASEINDPFIESLYEWYFTKNYLSDKQAFYLTKWAVEKGILPK